MKFSVFYFSGTGNTEWAANEFSKRIQQKNHECAIYSIENEIENLQLIIEQADYIGFCFPVYGADMPHIIKEFFETSIGSLQIDHKRCFIITTVGYVDAMGPFVVNKALKKYNLELAGYLKLKICNNISLSKHKANSISGDALKLRLDKCLAGIDRLIEKLVSHQKYITNIGPYLIPGIIIRKVTDKGKKNHHKLLSVSMSTCSSCMKCVNNCPTKSIIYSDEGFTFLSTCTSCMRCYNFCPMYAIYYDSKYADPSIYKRFKGIDLKVEESMRLQ